ncbi:hypothetical protein GQ457_16G002490 [Hibiscus cannabinus]
MSGSRNRFPFTATQCQELEHQALIFKYVVSGNPIPPDLLFSIKRSCFDTRLFSSQPPPPHVGWNCFQVGLGRKVDPEPGRCRRTDGKKWRCSKEAYTDSKYCEKHMHRGKNRSRKPVEVSTATPTTRAVPSLSFMDYRKHGFFSEPCGTMRSFSGSSNQSECSYLQLQSKKDDENGEPRKTVHRFFDEWPPKHRDPWLDSVDDKPSNGSSVSTTRLSISIPSTSNDFAIFNSRAHNGIMFEQNIHCWIFCSRAEVKNVVRLGLGITCFNEFWLFCLSF